MYKLQSGGGTVQCTNVDCSEADADAKKLMAAYDVQFFPKFVLDNNGANVVFSLPDKQELTAAAFSSFLEKSCAA